MARAFIVSIFSLILGLTIFLLPFVLLILLQIWLCKKGGKLGLILPILSLTLSLFMAAIPALMIAGPATVGTKVEGPDGAIIFQQEENVYQEVPVNTYVALGVLFLVANIPTAVYGGIWLHYKNRRDIIDDLKRMQLEDLE